MRTFFHTTPICLLWSASVLAAVPVALPLRLVVDQAPLTLNPRMSLDASGQRIGAMIFRGLTRIGPDFKAEPDLAGSWTSDLTQKRWTFLLVPGLVDHAGGRILTDDVLNCLEEYRAGKPRSLVGANFTRWVSTHRKSASSIEVVLDEADPYFPKNASLLRFFRSGQGRRACAEPQPGAEVVGSGPLRPAQWVNEPKDHLVLHPVEPDKTKGVELLFVRDELTRLLHLLRGLVDGGVSTFSLSKTAWLVRTQKDRFTVLEKDGVNVQYLAFNLLHPILAHREVRQEISLAIDSTAFSNLKNYGYLKPTGSFLAPFLSEAEAITLPFDLQQAERLLDSAGFPRGPHGLRFTLRYKTTPLRDGFEVAQYVRENLSHIGIEVEIETVENALLVTSMRTGNFELYSSRWVGVSDASILWRTLYSGSKSNRVHYRDAETDGMLKRAMTERNEKARTARMRKIQIRMAQELPYAPLWIWKTQFIVRKERAAEFSLDLLSPSAAIEPLTRRPP